MIRDLSLTWLSFQPYVPLLPRADEIQLTYDQGYPARIGFVVLKDDGSSYGEETLNSGRWSTDPSGINAYRADRDVMQISHNTTGEAIFRLDNNGGSYSNPRKSCSDWYMVRHIL